MSNFPFLYHMHITTYHVKSCIVHLLFRLCFLWPLDNIHVGHWDVMQFRFIFLTRLFTDPSLLNFNSLNVFLRWIWMTVRFTPNGKTELPFEIPLKPKGNKPLYETYHGVFVNIQVFFQFYMLSTECYYFSMFNRLLYLSWYGSCPNQ